MWPIWAEWSKYLVYFGKRQFKRPDKNGLNRVNVHGSMRIVGQLKKGKNAELVEKDLTEKEILDIMNKIVG